MKSSLLARILVMSLLFLVCPSMALAQGRSPSWSEPVDITGGADDGRDLFGILLCDRAQNVHLLWGKSYEGGSAIYYRSNSERFWSDPVDVLALPDPVAIRLRALITQDDVLHLFWESSWIGGDTYYSRVPLPKAADVRYWSAPRILEQPGGSVSESPDGVLHRVYGISESAGLQVALYHTTSSDGGDTWEKPTQVWEEAVPVPSGVSAIVDTDDRGRIHVGVTVRSTEYGLFSELGYLRSLDSGKTWQPYRTVQAPTADNSNFSTLAPYAFGADEVHLTWHEPARMHQWSNDGGDTWGVPQEIMPLGAAFGGENQLAKDSAGNVHVVTAVGGGVYSAQWNGVSWSAPERIESRFMDPHAQSIVVCGGNRIYVVYDDRHEENATVWLSTRTVDAPALPGVPLRTTSSIEMPESASVRIPKTKMPDPQVDTTQTELATIREVPDAVATAAGTFRPLLLSSVAVGVLVGVAATVTATRRRPHGP